MPCVCGEMIMTHLRAFVACGASTVSALKDPSFLLGPQAQSSFFRWRQGVSGIVVAQNHELYQRQNCQAGDHHVRYKDPKSVLQLHEWELIVSRRSASYSSPTCSFPADWSVLSVWDLLTLWSAVQPAALCIALNSQSTLTSPPLIFDIVNVQFPRFRCT